VLGPVLGFCAPPSEVPAALLLPAPVNGF